MNIPEKIAHVATFNEGMNTVVAMEAMKPTQARKITNCHITSTAVGEVLIVTNVKGNTLIESQLPEGRNKCIGTIDDLKNMRFFYFIWNEAGYHKVMMYDAAAKMIVTVLTSITDTGGQDILNFKEFAYIMMGAVVRGNLLYWVDGVNEARKLNISKCIAKGYGEAITEEFISAYKYAPPFAPSATYNTDTTRNTNTLYGSLMRFAVRFVFDDGEKSDWSDWSDIAIPNFESFSGVNIVPSQNNCLDLVIPTGPAIVVAIEIAMQRTIDTGISNWELIATVDKRRISMPDNARYTYRFYRDGKYPGIDQEKIIRSYSYLPEKPVCMAYTQDAMIYGNFYEGWETVNVNASVDVLYRADQATTPGSTQQENQPRITIFSEGSNWLDYVANADAVLNSIRMLNKDQLNAIFFTPFRVKKIRVTIGNDVKQGNIFQLRLYNNKHNFDIRYTATRSDTAASVLNKLRENVINTKLIIASMDSIEPTNIYETKNDGQGNMSFEFIIFGDRDGGYIETQVSVNPIRYDVINDTGRSFPVNKMGSTGKLGFIYQDRVGRRSAVYTNDNLVYRIQTHKQAGGIMISDIFLTINHKPPVWATSYQVVRTKDLNYDSFIQMLAQKVIDVSDSGVGKYMDIVVGSLFTYQKMHPNTTLAYEFKAGDRVKFIQNNNDVYYDDFETEILSYKPTTEEVVNTNIILNGTSIVTVEKPLESHIGKFIEVNSIEREIIGVSGTTYTLSAPIGEPNVSKTEMSYRLIDRRGLLRIRKPNIPVTDNSLIEIYSPPATAQEAGSKIFYYFNQRYDIINPGQPDRMHAGSTLNQTVNSGAEVKVTAGSIYTRFRELPITNVYPGTQSQVMQIEDMSYSDFYSSKIISNGKTTAEDTGLGRVHFGSRLRFSNLNIDDTSINGLNDFDNTDRKDYNDRFGDFKLLVFTGEQLLAFKQEKDCIIPVFQTIIQDNAGTELLGTSSELLNDLRYYGHEGGIGDHPESYASYGSRHYHASASTGQLIRLGGDGATPISEVYNLDNTVRTLLKESALNKTPILGGFDPVNKNYVVCFKNAQGEGQTLGFDDNIKQWNSYWSYSPDFMVNFFGSFFSFKNGTAWEHHTNPVYNNFYGEQYQSEITFFVNTAADVVKLFSTIDVDSNKLWTSEFVIHPSEGKSRGMQSRLKKNRFKFLEGKWRADILRNMIDPRFEDQMIALFSGEPMKGQVMEVTIANTDTDLVRLKSVTVRMSK